MQKTKQDELQEKISVYEKAIEGSSDPATAQLWKDKQSQITRFNQILHDLDFSGKSILDVGCGFGDIIDHIDKVATNYTYTGIDMTPGMIENARRNHPGKRFIVGDYFSNPLDESYDSIICCGALNSNFAEPFEYRTHAIETMFHKVNHSLVFNMAGGYPQPLNKEGSRIYYIDSLTVLKYCASLTSKLIFRHHYHPKDFTIVMYK